MPLIINKGLVQHYLIIICTRDNLVLSRVLVVCDRQVGNLPSADEVNIELAVIGSCCVVGLLAITALDTNLQVLAFTNLDIKTHIIDATSGGIGGKTCKGCRLAFGQDVSRVLALHTIILYARLVACLSIKTRDAQLRGVLPHSCAHLIDAWLEFLGRYRLVETEVVGNDASRTCHVACPFPLEVRAVGDAAVVVRPCVALPTQDGAVAGFVDGGLEVPVVCDALRVLFEVVVGQYLVAKVILRNRFPC